MASSRALSLATIETPFFGLSFPGYVDPRVPDWHLGMHMKMGSLKRRLTSSASSSAAFGQAMVVRPEGSRISDEWPRGATRDEANQIARETNMSLDTPSHPDRPAELI